MSFDDIVPWEWLEQWSSTLFIVAAVMLGGAGVVKALSTTAGIELPLVLQNILGGQGGFLVALLGLTGLYPRLSDRMPRLSRVVAISIVVAVIGQLVTLAVLIAIFVWNTATGATVEPPMVTFVFLMAGYLGTILAFIGFGINGIRSQTPSLLVGVLFLLLPLVTAGLLAVPVDLPSFAGIELAAIWQPLALLAIGYLLRTESTSTDSVKQEIDSPTR